MTSEHRVVLKDRDGYDICEDLEYRLADAKKRAKYLLSDDHARAIGSTHKDLGTYKVEVQAPNGECIWDSFK